jgi:hypothetical protein
MAAALRIYAVLNGDKKARLVRASHPANALQHVARTTYTVRVATQADLETLLGSGIKVEEIKAEQGELPA